MNVVIRTDSSAEIGTGHVMRCLTLAEELRDGGAKVSFICRDLPGNLCDYIEQKGYTVHSLPNKGENDADGLQKTPYAKWLGVDRQTDFEQSRSCINKGQDVDWLIVDHYALDKQWETEMRPYVKKIMVIDDLANRPHDCDLLLDQNLYENTEARYNKLVPEGCIKLLGPKYALLRKEFREASEKLRERDGSIRRIFIFFGGSDHTNETSKALKAIQLLKRPDIVVDVVVGASNPHKEDVRKMCANMANTNYYCQVENMAELMAAADLAIGAVGTTTWERCFLGLSAITVVIAQNQLQSSNSLANTDAVRNLGWHYEVDAEDLAEAIKKAIDMPAEVKKMGMNALSVTEGSHLTSAALIMQKLTENKPCQDEKTTV